MSILAYPFHVLASILRFVFQALRIPLPNIPFSSLSFSSLFSAIRAPPVDPYTESDRWVRQLEEETGATRRGHSPSSIHDEYEYDDAAAAAGASGSIGLRSRRKGENDGVRGVLPDFWIGSYEDALRTCRDQYRIACIVLVSAEHDDTLPFKRDTLTDPTLVDVLTKENILVWGADTRGREGWSASHKLGATTSPFVAFVALQPPRGTRAPTTATSTPTMTVLSRHSGLTSTRAPALLTHLTTHLLPRVSPFLTRLRVQAEERALERRLRDEQDARFAESARRDREKAEAARVEEARRVEREEEERRGREEAERKRKEVEKVKEAWRGAGRNAVVRRVEEGGKEKGGVRVGIRFPDGARIASAFDPSEPILALFCVVDAHLHPSSSPSLSSYPPNTNTSKAAEEDVQALMTSHAVTPDDWFGFKIFTSYPRREISFGPGRTVESEGVEGSVSVELVSGGVGGRKGESEKGEGEGSDGYETEDE